MKRFLFYLTLLMITINSCSKRTDKVTEQKENLTVQAEKKKPEKLEPEFNRENYSFIDSVIPKELLSFVLSIDSSYRLPEEKDYDDYYFKGYDDEYEIKELPFFCYGNFNGDSIIDYSLVLIKDSTEQLVYAFHSTEESFTPYLLNRAPLTYSQNKKFKTVFYSIWTDNDRVMEAIDTTYIVENDVIAIEVMVESETYSTVWNRSTDSYVDLYFD